MTTGAIISYGLLLLAVYFLVQGIMGIANMYFKLLAQCILNKKHPAYSATGATLSTILCLFYIILFCTGHVNF